MDLTQISKFSGKLSFKMASAFLPPIVKRQRKLISRDFFLCWPFCRCVAGHNSSSSGTKIRQKRPFSAFAANRTKQSRKRDFLSRWEIKLEAAKCNYSTTKLAISPLTFLIAIKSELSRVFVLILRRLPGNLQKLWGKKLKDAGQLQQAKKLGSGRPF